MHVLLASVSSATSPAGVCRHAANIARGMAASPGVQKITLLVGDWQAPYFREAFALRAPNLEIQTVAISNTSIARNLWYLRTLPRIARECGAHIVHLAYPMPLLRFRFKVPVVLSLHDLYPFDIPQNFGNRRAWLNRTALRICLRNVDAIACVSKPTQNRLKQLFSGLENTRISVIPNAVTTSKPAPLPRSIPPQFLLCVAQHRANKNLQLLLRAFRQALDQDILPPTCSLIIVGNEGPETQSLHHLVAESHLSSRVVFLHNIPDSTLSALYTHCELFIAPSLLEGFGLPLAEAIAAGCRIACSNIPIFKHLAPNSAFFDPTVPTADSLLIAIRQALKTPRQSPLPGFTPQQAAALYLQLYSRLRQHPTPASSPTALHASGDL